MYSAHQSTRCTAAADIAADAHIHVDDRAHGRPGAAGLDDLTDERAGLVHDAVADLDAAVAALAERERARPVRRAVGHDVRGLELEVRVPLREAQQVTIALVFRDRLLPFTRLCLSLGQLRAQLLVFGLELVIFINVAVDALEPLRRDGRGLLQRRAHDAVEIREESRLAAERPGDQREHEHDRDHDRADTRAFLFQIRFPVQSSSTPSSFNSCPSLHSGRPITLK